MENKSTQELKPEENNSMEDPTPFYGPGQIASSSFAGGSPGDFSTTFEHDTKTNSFGLMDVVQDCFGYSSLHDYLMPSPPPLPPPPEALVDHPAAVEPQDAVTTPNSNSFSSSSSHEAAVDDQPQALEEEKADQDKDTNSIANKQSKGKRKNQKRQREPRFAFVTKSNVDHLDDGYRWRKYGQKAVRNSPYPRSYYRCTAAACGVKKRVERSSSDPTTVVTTYEGQHTHPYPLVPRVSGSAGIQMQTATIIGGVGGGMCGQTSPIHPFFQRQPPLPPPPPELYFNPTIPSLSFNAGGSTGNSAFPSVGTVFPVERGRLSRPSYPSVARDDGLLQDMVPFQMLKVPDQEDDHL
ncbi:hypothetical protein Ancab_030067 [Ancistrocladus abbreviatus]